MMAHEQTHHRLPPARDGVGSDGSITATLHLPFSNLASAAARRVFTHRLGDAPSSADPLEMRAHYNRFNDGLADAVQRKFRVKIIDETMGGVPVQRVIPLSDKAPQEDAVLINLHGGAFMWGAGSGALVEAVPIAVATNMPVIAVDYRMAPEHKFPAASEDAVAVYQHLLKLYAPRKIGVFGLSAGAILAAQVVAWLQRHNIPLPGAVAMLGGSGMDFGGDSNALNSATMGEPEGPAPRSILASPYMQNANGNDPLAMPVCDDSVLAKFPPSLLISASRDFAASSVTQFHRRLNANGVDARLFLFDGLWHAFHIFCELPESDEVSGIVAAFFKRELKLA